MPIVTNHRGPSFREYKRTPTENKVVELESKVADLAKLVEELRDGQSTSTKSTSRKKKEATDS